MDIKEYSDIVLNVTGGDPLLVTYKESAGKVYNKNQTVDFSNAIRDLDHDPKVDPYEGIKRTSEWSAKMNTDCTVILVVFGTRPEALKMVPLVKELIFNLMALLM